MNHFGILKHIHSFDDEPIDHDKIILGNIANIVLLANFVEYHINGASTNETTIMMDEFLVELIFEQIVLD
jgi:hypothetical protein